MAWNLKQKAVVHVYKAAAGLADQEYRALLQDVTGCTSAAAPGLTQYHFDQFMARIEGKLAYQIQEGWVRPPEPSAKIRDLSYWRDRLPAAGEPNGRQMHLIGQLWEQLVPLLPAEHRSTDYLMAMAAKAARRRLVSLHELAGWQAGVLTEALKDRLRYALKATSVPPPATVIPSMPNPTARVDTEDSGPDDAVPVYAGGMGEVPF